MNTDLLDRNLGLLTEEEYKVLSEKTVLIAGCGVGSVVAVGAARTGFHSFVLADGDIVEPTNLNRQEFISTDIGRQKAEALADKLRGINPHAKAKVIPNYLAKDNLTDALSGVDLIVDAIDPIESPGVVVELHSRARSQSIPVVYPIDIGWGGGVFVFTPESSSLEEMLGFKESSEAISDEAIRAAFLGYFAGIVPDYFGSVMSDVMTGKLGNIPQPASAAYIAAALSVVALKRLALGLPVRLAPEMISFDPHTPHISGE